MKKKILFQMCVWVVARLIILVPPQRLNSTFLEKFSSSIRVSFGDPSLEIFSKNVDFSLSGKQCIVLKRHCNIRHFAAWWLECKYFVFSDHQTTLILKFCTNTYVKSKVSCFFCCCCCLVSNNTLLSNPYSLLTSRQQGVTLEFYDWMWSSND